MGTFRSTWSTKPVLVYPADNATDITDVYFDWNAVLGAKTYQLQVSPNGDWANNKTIDVTVEVDPLRAAGSAQQRELLLAGARPRRSFRRRELRALVRQRRRHGRRAGLPAWLGRQAHHPLAQRRRQHDRRERCRRHVAEPDVLVDAGKARFVVPRSVQHEPDDEFRAGLHHQPDHQDAIPGQ